jgi:class 3 adenylate cyclase/tetratricopeptide (TPR) repeat protein
MACGTALEPDATGDASRKVVTVVFCDVVGSTPLGERLDPESVRQLMSRFFDAMRVVLERHGGRVEKYIGDAVVAVFGVPLLHEDDAIRAVRATADMRTAVAELRAELEDRWGSSIEVRIGVNTGEVAVGGDGAEASFLAGDALNVASRLESAAAPGDVLLGADTYALVRDLIDAEAVAPLLVKGKSEPVAAYRLRAIAPSATETRPEPPIVDRTAEIAGLRDAFDTTMRDRRAALVLVLGSAGVGKSRLAREFVDRLRDDAVVLSGRCLPYGDGITFWPVAEIVRQAAGILESDDRDEGRRKIQAAVAASDDAALIVDRVASVTGLAPVEGGMQETFWAIRRFLEVVAARRPVVVVFDDIQWAEPTFLDLLEYLAGWSRDVPLLLLCVARPDLLDARPAWAGVADEARSIRLAPLAAADTERLVVSILGGPGLDQRSITTIADSAGGNPLFVEEMLRMFEDDGLLHHEGSGWSAAGDLSRVPVPATIQALVSARLDRLSADERTVIRCAAVVGREFWWGAVAELVPDRLRPAVGAHLQTLVRKELIRPAESAVPGEDAFRFHHLLIQEAAYDGTPKEMRADLHERFADWIQVHAGDRTVEYEEVIGYHLEQAVTLRGQLAWSPERLRPLAERAAATLAAAGRRARGRGDMPAAADLLGRAADLRRDDEAARLPLLPELGEALMEIGELARAEEVLASAIADSARAGDARTASHAKVIRLLMLESTEPKARSEEALRELRGVVPVFEAVGDELGLARAWRLTADVHLARARYAEADDALRRAIEHARSAGAFWEESEALGQFIGSGVYGPVDVDEVRRRCDEVIERARGNLAMEARAWRGLAHAAAMTGDGSRAAELIARSRAVLQDLGLRLRAAFATETQGFIAHLAGDHAQAAGALREGFDIATEFGEVAYASTVAALLSRELAELGELDEAERLMHASAELAAEDDLTTQILWRTANALVLAGRGDPAGAERSAADAVDLARDTDDLNMRADALVALADVTDDDGAQTAALREALELYDAKGNAVSSDAVRRRLSG